MSEVNTFLKRKPAEIRQKAKRYLEELSTSSISPDVACTSKTEAPDNRKSIHNKNETIFRLKSLDKYINDLSVSSEDTRSKLDALLTNKRKKKELFKRATDVRPEIPSSALKHFQPFPTSTPLHRAVHRVDNLTISPIEKANKQASSDNVVVVLERNESVEECVKVLNESKEKENHSSRSVANISDCRKDLFCRNSDGSFAVRKSCEKSESFVGGEQRNTNKSGSASQESVRDSSKSAAE